MRCEACRELLSPFLDGVCNEKENKMVQAHLNVCSGCHDQLEEMRRMAEFLHHMSLPSLPEGFAESLHRKLDAENLIMFTPHEFKVPRKQSWIAAAVAGVALVGGIYASTVLPLGSMIASWQERNQDNAKPKVAVNEILKHIDNEQTAQVADKNAVTKPDQKAVDTLDKSAQTEPRDTYDKATSAPNTDNSLLSTAEQRLADAAAIRLTVANASESRKQVVQIAAANGLSYSYNNNGCLQALSGPTAQGVTLKVEPQDVDKVLQQLADLGQAVKPTRSTVDMSEQFKEVQTKMEQVQQERQKLTAKVVISSQEIDRLDELNAQLQSLTDQQSRLEKEARLVTINVYFVEAVNP